VQRLARAVRDRRPYVEPSRANGVGDAKIDSAFRNVVAVGVFFVVSLTRTAAAGRGDLGMNVGESERVRSNRGGFARPRRVAVDPQLKYSEEPRLAEVVTGQALVLRALATSVDDEQRRSRPRVKRVGTDDRVRHLGRATGP